MGQQLAMGTTDISHEGRELPTIGTSNVWQPQLLTAPRRGPGAAPASAPGLVVGELYRQRGLAGVAEARAALAEASRRAEARQLHEAA